MDRDRRSSRPKRRIKLVRARHRDGARLADDVYLRVKADIFEFRLLPGARLSENELAARAQVSRTPVREALLRLAREGFVEVLPRSGWRVRPLDFERFDHLYDVRIVLEVAAAQRLCARPPASALAELARTWLAPAAAQSTDWLEVARLDEAFHAALVAATGNPELIRMHTDVTERIRIVRRLDFTQADRIACTYAEHGGILRAVMAGDAERTGMLLRAHIEQSKDEVRRISLLRLHAAHQTARAAG